MIKTGTIEGNILNTSGNISIVGIRERDYETYYTTHGEPKLSYSTPKKSRKHCTIYDIDKAGEGYWKNGHNNDFMRR